MKNKFLLTPYEKALRNRDYILFGASFLLALATFIIGTVLGEMINESAVAICFIASISFVALALFFNVLASLLYAKKLNEKSNSEMITYIYSHRDRAEKNALMLMKKLSCLLTCLKIYSALMLISGFIIAFSAGVGDLGVTFVLASLCIIYAILSRIDFPTPKVLFSADNAYVEESDFPELYAVAREAADAIGIKGKIKICLISDFTAGIRRFGNVISVQISAMLHNAMSREELRSILLHEFAHLSSDGTPAQRLQKHQINLTEDDPPSFSLSRLTAILFKFFDGYFLFHHMLYTYASTIGAEEKADKAMITYGEPKYAGSAFLKLKYYSLYEWESGSYDDTPLFAPEELSRDLLKNSLASFKERIDLCRDFWNELIDVEIISKSATHPTIKMRLEALGHTDYSLHESKDSEAYIAEQRKAIDLVDDRIYEEGKDEYEEERSRVYLAPLKDITEWEEAGKPINAETYRDMIYAYRLLCRENDALELCNRVIETLPDAANHFAYFIKGCILLHSFDESGIEYIYHAIENNHNYIEEGMDTIGQFCCICGKEDDLETYRERAVSLMNDQEQKYLELSSISSKDNLASESLPEDIKADLLRLVSSMADSIDEVYVVRKIITADFFASAVIVLLNNELEDEAKSMVINRLFQFLDTQDWEFTLFDSSQVPMNTIKKIPLSLFYDSKDHSLNPWHGKTLKS